MAPQVVVALIVAGGLFLKGLGMLVVVYIGTRLAIRHERLASSRSV